MVNQSYEQSKCEFCVWSVERLYATWPKFYLTQAPNDPPFLQASTDPCVTWPNTAWPRRHLAQAFDWNFLNRHMPTCRRPGFFPFELDSFVTDLLLRSIYLLQASFLSYFLFWNNESNSTVVGYEIGISVATYRDIECSVSAFFIAGQNFDT